MVGSSMSFGPRPNPTGKRATNPIGAVLTLPRPLYTPDKSTGQMTFLTGTGRQMTNERRYHRVRLRYLVLKGANRLLETVIGKHVRAS
jgi:hypothetical protein